MAQCQFLTMLCLNRVLLTTAQTHELPKQIESFQNLKELHFLNCPEIISNWPASFCISKVEKLALSDYTTIPKHFFEYFKNLSSLFMCICDSRNCNGCNINLDICDCHGCNSGFENSDTDDDCVDYYCRHLKSLHIDYIEHAVLRTLNNGILEDLMIRSGEPDEENWQFNTLLQFNKLLRFSCRVHAEHSLWKFITKSEMPTLQSFEYSNDEFQKKHQLTILKSIESITSLKSIYLELHFEQNSFTFLQKIIGILKKPCTTRRPFFA